MGCLIYCATERKGILYLDVIFLTYSNSYSIAQMGDLAECTLEKDETSKI